MEDFAVTPRVSGFQHIKFPVHSPLFFPCTYPTAVTRATNEKLVYSSVSSKPMCTCAKVKPGRNGSLTM